MSDSIVPKGLRYWFVAHFIADYLFAIPLLFFPSEILSFFNWESIDPLATRLVAAALMGIGGESLIGRNGNAESFLTMLRLKILWSLAANFGIALSIFEGAAPLAWGFQGIFITFSVVWIYYWVYLKKKSKAHTSDLK